ncbi:hypothetical protein FEM48_Zijuj11G0133500 [Ziziphus jujuba var. spinosa]|uniref:Disease resistance protein RPM1-like n=1 Tax=Ziziphus jujuba var. spinosa TaxID=714518 RepID=A0A978UJ63_ZIZJJ|nr:hypothetical protein FEM48_Zijuj11G0133500 [Ziziphus jujuba var. spinosa]
MAESVVTFLLQKLDSFAHEKANLLCRIREEAEHVRDELERIRAFLRDADAKEEGDEELRVWIKQVREVSHDIEDLLDEFLLRFSNHGNPHGFYGRLYNLARIIKNLKARHRIASGLQASRSRVTNISEGHQRYRYKLNFIEEGSSTSPVTANNNWHDLRGDALCLEEAKLVGIDKHKPYLIDELIGGSSELQVVAVAGMGGLGKTTLVRQVYKDDAVKRHFQHHAWVTVSQVFKLEDVVRDIVQQLFDEIKQTLPQDADSSDSDQNFVSIIGEQSRALPEKPRRLSIHKPLENVGGEHNLSSLRSLFYFGAKHDSISNFSMSIFFNSGLRLLEVLNCRGAPLNKFPKEILKLYNLRYLSLRDTNVSSIPKSIGKLQKLYSLDLRYTYVTELPVEILQLKQLRQLLVYRYVHEFTTSIEVVGFKALRGLETLSSLQSLCYIEVNQGDSNLMKSLGELTQLRRLCILKLKAEDGNYLCSSIEKLRFVLSLSLVSISPDEVLDLQNMSSPPQCLRHLELSGRLETFPHWISYLSNLSHVGLQWSRLQVNPFESLQALPNLVVIEFVKAYDGETLYFKAEGFKMLKMLALGKFDRLKRVTIEKGALPVLEKLSFTDCKLLEEVPSGIEDLRNLQELELVDMSNEFLMKLRQRTDLMHIPDVFIGRETDCGLDGYFL